MPEITDPSVLSSLNGAPRPARGGVFTLPPDPLEVNRDVRAGNADARASAAAERAAANAAAQLDLEREKFKTNQGTQRTFDNTRSLKNDFASLPVVKGYEAIAPLLMQGLRAHEDATGDQTLLYRYAKVMDPGSVVRESEQDAAAKGAGYWDAAVANIKKQVGIEGGGALSPEIRQRLKRDMLQAAQEMGLSYRQARARYSRDAADNGIDPKYVVGPDAFEPYQKQFAEYQNSLQGKLAQQSGRGVSSVTPWQFTAPGAGARDFAGSGDSTKGIAIPPQMQAEYEAYVKQHAGNLEPNEYAQFRNDLAQRHGFGGTPELTQTYKDEAARLNGYVKGGQQLNLNIPPAEDKLTARDRINNAVFDNPGGAAVFGAGSGWSDEVLGTAKSIVDGTDTGVEVAKMNALRQGMADKYPKANLAGQIGSAALGAYAIPNLPFSSALNTTAGTIGTGAALGAFSGAGESNDSRMLGSMFGAGLGAAGGAAGRALAAPIESLARSDVGQKVGQVVSRARGQPFNPAPQLSTLESAAYGLRPDVAQASRNLRDAGDLGLPYSLADADPKLRMLGGAVTRKSTNTRDLAERTFEPRARGQADRAISAIDQHLAPYTDIEARGRDLIEAGNMASRPYYDMAGQVTNPTRPGMEMFYSQAANPDPELTAILNTPTGKQALNRASRILADRGGSARSVGLAADKNGNTILQDGYSFEALDLVKKGLDDIIQDSADPITGKVNFSGKPQLQAIEGLRKRFVERLDVANPTYKKARETYQPYAQRKEALDTGYNVLARNDVPERVFNERLSALPAGTMDETQRGYATALTDSANKLRYSANPFEALYGAPLQQQKIAALFPEGAPQIGRQYELERDMAKTANETLGGSPTAGRLQADQQIGGGLGTMAVDALSSAATGGGLSLGTAFKAARNLLGDSAKLGMGRAGVRKADDIGRGLFDTSDPYSVANTLDDLARKYGVIDSRRAEVAKRLGMFGASMAPKALSW